LEHFARLAADVAGTCAAVVSVVSRRKELGPKRVAYGLSPEQQSAIQNIEGFMDSGPGLTIVPDLTSDERFGLVREVFEQPRLRFLAFMRLISPGGQQVGFICLLDATPRPDLTPDQRATLGHIANLIIADRQREQRHLHLMHVADRALRVDRMLRLVSEAASCADALTNLLESLCRFHGAAVGQIWQLTQPGEPPVEISRYLHDHQRGFAYQFIEPSMSLNEATADAIQHNKPRAIEFSRLGSPKPTGDAETPKPAGDAETPEPTGDAETNQFSGYVCVPIWAQQQRFGISLTFARQNVELEPVVDDIASLGDTIRPALVQKVTEERIRFAAHHDDLTQLSNRLLFQERLRKAIGTARTTGRGFALLCLDLDGFKLVNDLHGHGFGDNLLIGIAQRLRQFVRESDTVGRMGGDEFAIIQQIDDQPSEAVSLAKRLIETVTRPFELGGRQAFVGVSIGIALWSQHGESPDQLLRNADQALYRAKNSGRKTYCVFDPAMEANHQEPFLVEQDLKDAINRADFSLAYQSICDARSSHIVGFEALLRWRHPLLGPIQPDLFIPLAERSGLIVPLGRWVLETACADAAKWARPAMLSVNLSPLQFRLPDLPDQVADVLRQTGLPSSRLQLEVTEGLLLDESDLVRQTMRRLQDHGVRIVLDDFGTSYANMNYLRRFPFDGIKIDKSLIRGLGNDEVTQAIVQSVLSLADRLNLAVVAEGVETERELNQLRKLGCRLIQGYLMGRPSDLHQANTSLRHSWSGDAEIDLKEFLGPVRVAGLVGP
jgi:diguanylate cyclase (GGDEF)-like protein